MGDPFLRHFSIVFLPSLSQPLLAAGMTSEARRKNDRKTKGVSDREELVPTARSGKNEMIGEIAGRTTNGSTFIL